MKKKITFQKKLTKQLDLEREKLTQKDMLLEQRKEKLKSYEERRARAFNFLEEAENLMNQTKFDEAIENYQQAELILNEIQFPTKAIKEMIQKVQEKKNENFTAGKPDP